ncbi:glycosyltransferase family 4 protein [Kiloniella sp. b19]|uniref:glycosyltransferase family 4 protein n=1 Tax=Kiloniella sp. GXU_MW_B19 TaxID=3141326 RepID=UPI0031E24C15
MTRIAIVTDAWHPQVNGVVRTMTTVVDSLRKQGHDVLVVSPDLFRTVPMPGYSEIRLAVLPGRKLCRMLDSFRPENIHISTEGPLGWGARNYCKRNKLAFTSSYHTRFPEYFSARIPVPLSWGYRVVRKFHGCSSAMMVATASLRDELRARGFDNAVAWTRGVDLECFNPEGERAHCFDEPLFLYVGRVSVEKNIEAFLALDLPGRKMVVGDGPQLESLKARWPEVLFSGARFGEDLAAHYRSGDVFVFPSRTDTFGLVLLEAMACGLAVAAYPVTGPLDVIADAEAAALDEDLGAAALRALELTRRNPEEARKLASAHAQGFSWARCVQRFRDNLVPVRS